MKTNNLNNDNKIEEMTDFFNLRARSYDDHMKGVIAGDFNNFYKTISFPIPDTNDIINILDLGCGTGLEIEGIFKKAPNAILTCVDLSSEMLSELKEKYCSYDENIITVEDSYLEFTYKPDKYNFIVSAMTMHHLEQDDKMKVYSSICNSLQKGACYIEGDYVVKRKEEKEIFNEYLALKKIHPEIDNGTYHIDIPFSKETQMKLFQDAGFSRVDIIWEKESSVIFVAHK
ncbi:MAG: class I SAM-dependent methyltransferase [Candidatus Pacebacteria bacterium]|nr:class I SAM-dependent methyltransferase [Candidatus Paceibacterota bacterium]